MNDRYQLLQNAYALRDHYALMIFGLAALIILVDQWALRSSPRWQFWFRIYVMLAWIGGIVYAALGGTL